MKLPRWIRLFPKSKPTKNIRLRNCFGVKRASVSCRKPMRGVPSCLPKSTRMQPMLKLCGRNRSRTKTELKVRPNWLLFRNVMPLESSKSNANCRKTTKHGTRRWTASLTRRSGKQSLMITRQMPSRLMKVLPRKNTNDRKKKRIKRATPLFRTA